nr:MAG TPA: hypothetical protein [Caudoviricetes sp.]
MSNFAIRPFTHTFEDGIQKTFQSVEQAFHYIKGLLFAPQDAYNNNVLDNIMNTTSGGELRRLGRKIKGLDVAKWDASSSNVMKQLLKESFEQNPKAAQRLLDTGNVTLTHNQDRSTWKTEFPRLLMEVRDELRKSQSDSVDQTSDIINLSNDPEEIITLSHIVIRPFVHTFENGSKKKFKSIAQAFQYIKATYADPAVNENIIRQIEQTTDLSELIDLGESIKQLDVKSWNNDSFNITKQLVKESFEQNPSAAKILLDKLRKS